MLDAAGREPDRVRDRARDEFPCAITDEAAQAEQVRAAVGVRIEPPRAAARPPAGSAGRRACRAAVAVISARSASSSVSIVPSSSFSATLPVKPSQTTTSAAPASRSRLSVLPPKLSSLAGEQRVRLERQLVPLLGLLADREQPHLGIGSSEDLLGEDRAHVRELEQVLGSRVGVGAGVEQHRRAALRRDRDGDRRPHHARDPPQVEQPGREHRAGVPGGDDRVRAALGDRAAGARRARSPASRGRLRRASRASRSHPAVSTSSRPPRLEPGGAEEDRRRSPSPRLERAGDDLDRARGRRPCVDRDAGHRRYGAGVRSGSISRPLYVLQVGQTRCGRFG